MTPDADVERFRPECPGGCGREDVPTHMFACPDCMDKLPMRLREPLVHRGPDTLPAIARAKLWWSNTSAS